VLRTRLTGAVSVVVLEDEEQDRSISAALRTWGFDVTSAGGVTGAHGAINERAAAIAVLDGRSVRSAVLDLLTKIRESGWSIPVLVVCPDESAIVTALHAGADDCFGPPYSADELHARVTSLLRRTYRVNTWRPVPVRIGRLSVCLATREATRDGIPIALSPKEHELLVVLLEQRGRVVPRSELMARIWPERARPNPRTLDIHIAWLRRKIEPDPRHPTVIQTVRSVGYAMAPPP